MNERYRELIESYIHAYNHFDVEGMTQDVDEQIVFENVSQGEVNLHVTGKEAFRKQAEAAKGYFSQRQQTITSWEFDTDIVTVEIDYEAVLAIDFPNGMKAGETLKMKGTSIFTFKGEKIQRIRDIS